MHAIGGSAGDAFLLPRAHNDGKEGLRGYFKAKIEEAEVQVRDRTANLRRLEAQRNELNTKGELKYGVVDFCRFLK